MLYHISERADYNSTLGLQGFIYTLHLLITADNDGVISPVCTDYGAKYPCRPAIARVDQCFYTRGSCEASYLTLVNMLLLVNVSVFDSCCQTTLAVDPS